MAGFIQPPIFIQYARGKVIAYGEAFEAELQPTDELPSFESVWDSQGHKLAFAVKQQHALRLESEEVTPRVEEFQSLLTEALQNANDIGVDELPLDKLVERALAQFRAPKKVDWDEVNWTDGCWQGCAYIAFGVLAGLTLAIPTAVRSVLGVRG